MRSEPPEGRLVSLWRGRFLPTLPTKTEERFCGGPIGSLIRYLCKAMCVPTYGVRFISINDGVDTANEQSGDDLQSA